MEVDLNENELPVQRNCEEFYYNRMQPTIDVIILLLYFKIVNVIKIILNHL